MRFRHLSILLLLLLSIGFTGAAHGQQAPEGRKVVRKALPTYPEIARRMNLAGTVKVLATVAPDGTVKDVRPMGGSPVLLQAAQDAVYKWKFAAGTESRELVELHFDPQ